MAYGNVTEDGQQDVDEEICVAATLEEDTEGREEDGKDDLADVGCGERHVEDVCVLSKRRVGIGAGVVRSGERGWCECVVNVSQTNGGRQRDFM